MKELSIEQKAKAYDEAIERAKKLKEDPQGVLYEYSYKEGDTICDYIFPELKESEDERIRKAILGLVRQSSEILGKQNQNNRKSLTKLLN